MATLSTPARQPFGILNESKIRSLQSLKNRQNAIVPNSASSLKRRAVSPDISDSENVDPGLHDSLAKRKRAAFDDDVSASKQPRLYTTIVPNSSKSRAFTPSVTPRIETFQRPSVTPLSAPAAAGRSPTRTKSSGINRKRFAPPSISTKSPGLSVAAALKGTLAHKKTKKVRTIEESKPKSWFFDIFEESEEQQDYRMSEWTMTQSSAALDLSDDESKSQEGKDRGKENIDPNEVLPTMTRSMTAAVAKAAVVPEISRKDAMLDEPRTPLSDLDAADYYPEGLDATSVVLVHEDEIPVEQVVLTETSVDISATESFTFEAPVKHTAEEQMQTSSAFTEIPDWAKISSASIDSVLQDTKECADIEIWESESAKDENEKQEEEALLEDTKEFALQEL